MKRDVIVTCAVTGGADTTGKNPNIPVTPKEIADTVAEVADSMMVWCSAPECP